MRRSFRTWAVMLLLPRFGGCGFRMMTGGRRGREVSVVPVVNTYGLSCHVVLARRAYSNLSL